MFSTFCLNRSLNSNRSLNRSNTATVKVSLALNFKNCAVFLEEQFKLIIWNYFHLWVYHLLQVDDDDQWWSCEIFVLIECGK